MRVLVTGGKGFIGRYVVERFSDVSTFDIVDGQDIRDAAAVMAAVEGHDHVVHLAGLLGTEKLFATPQAAVDVNVTGTLNVLEACRVHGAGYTGIAMPDCWPNLYQATRLCGMRMAESYRAAYGLRVNHVRAYNVHGPGQSTEQDKFIPNWASAAWRGEPLKIYGDGTHTIDVVPVRRVASVFRAVLWSSFKHGPMTGVIEAGSGVGTTPIEVANYVRTYVASHGGPSVGVEFMPMRKGETVDPGEVNVAPYGCGFSWSDLDETIESYRPC